MFKTVMRARKKLSAKTIARKILIPQKMAGAFKRRIPAFKNLARLVE
jgi:hypothetical protein